MGENSFKDIKTPEDFDLAVQQDPDFVKTHTAGLFVGALETNPDLTVHLLKNYQEHIDMDRARQWICQKDMAGAYRVLEPCFNDVETLLKDCIKGGAIGVLKAVLDSKEIPPAILNDAFKAFCENSILIKYPVCMDLIDKGADFGVLDSKALYGLLYARPNLAYDPLFRKALAPHADAVMTFAINQHEDSVVDLLNDKFADDIKKEDEHLRHVLNIGGGYLINAYPILKHERYHNQEIFMQWLINRADQNTDLEFYIQIANRTEPGSMSGHFLEKLATENVYPHAWAALDIFIEKGLLDLKAYPEIVPRLLERVASGWHAGFYSLEALLAADDSVDIDKLATWALLSNNKPILTYLFEKHGARASKLDWQLIIETYDGKPEEVMQGLACTAVQLKKEQKEADALCFEALKDYDFAKAQKNDWLKEGGLLQVVAASEDFGGILLKLKNQAGLRFTAEEFSESGALGVVAGFMRHKALLAHAYWQEEMPLLGEVFGRIPLSARVTMGKDFVAEIQQKLALSKAAKKPHPLPRRR